MRSHEDRQPRDIVEPKQEANALRYELVVRLAPPYKTRRLVIRHFEDGEVVCCILGASLVIPTKEDDGA